MAHPTGTTMRTGSAEVHIEPMPIENVKVSVEARDEKEGAAGESSKKGVVHYAGFVAGIASVRGDGKYGAVEWIGLTCRSLAIEYRAGLRCAYDLIESRDRS